MRTPESEKRRKRLIQMIHIGKAKLGLEEDAYRAFLAGTCGRETCAAMTIRQLEAALRAMRGAGFSYSARRVRGEEIGKGATLAQLEYIKRLWAEASRLKTEASLRAMLRRIAGVDHLRFLTNRKASDVIRGLRNIARLAAASGEGPKEGRDG